MQSKFSLFVEKDDNKKMIFYTKNKVFNFFFAAIHIVVFYIIMTFFILDLHAVAKKRITS